MMVFTGHYRPERTELDTNILSGHPYILSQCHKGLVQFPRKFQVIHDFLVFG